jgi:CO/xanthine dehydrogenase FAD-binding subunit
MRLPRFDVLLPGTVEEACALLAAHRDDGVRLLAGGTDLLVDLRERIIPQHIPRCDGCSSHPQGSVRSTIDCNLWATEPTMASGGSIRSFATHSNKPAPKFLVSLHKILDLKGIRRLDDGSLQIGAMTTIREIERSQLIRSDWTALAHGADNLGSPLVRNRGTLGGNVANARPAADTVIPIVALDGVLTLQSSSAQRTVPAAEFPTGPGVTVLAPEEIVTHIHLPKPPPHSASAYYKLANRKALEISTVGVAVWMALERANGPIAAVHIALGAVGPTPLLAKTARDFLLHKVPTERTLKEAARITAQDARPIDDHRGSASYRLQMVELLAERLLNNVARRAMGEYEKDH